MRPVRRVAELLSLADYATTMKRILGITTVLIATGSLTFATTYLGAGQWIEYEFNSLPLTGVVNSPLDYGAFRLTVPANGYLGGELLMFEIYEGSTAVDPLHRGIYEFLPNRGDIVLMPAFPDAWADLQGAFRMTMLSGSIEFNEMAVLRYLPLSTGQSAIYSATVPEPSASLFMLVGAVCLGWTAARRRFGSCPCTQSIIDIGNDDG